MAEGSNAAWKFTGDEAGAAPAAPKNVQSVTWTASEYVEHEKSGMWYVWFALVAIGGTGFIYVLTRDVMSVFILAILAIGFGFFAARKPHVLQYRLESNGITIGTKFYPITMFRSFAVVEEGAMHSISLLPMKRFMPAISLYYAPDDEEKLLDTFGSLLPQEARTQDPLDKFMNRIKF